MRRTTHSYQPVFHWNRCCECEIQWQYCFSPCHCHSNSKTVTLSPTKALLWKGFNGVTCLEILLQHTELKLLHVLFCQMIFLSKNVFCLKWSFLLFNIDINLTRAAVSNTEPNVETDRAQAENMANISLKLTVLVCSCWWFDTRRLARRGRDSWYQVTMFLRSLTISMYEL